jgi:hypothetical protein
MRGTDAVTTYLEVLHEGVPSHLRPSLMDCRLLCDLSYALQNDDVLLDVVDVLLFSSSSVGPFRLPE